MASYQLLTCVGQPPNDEMHAGMPCGPHKSPKKPKPPPHLNKALRGAPPRHPWSVLGEQNRKGQHVVVSHVRKLYGSATPWYCFANEATFHLHCMFERARTKVDEGDIGKAIVGGDQVLGKGSLFWDLISFPVDHKGRCAKFLERMQQVLHLECIAELNLHGRMDPENPQVDHVITQYFAFTHPAFDVAVPAGAPAGTLGQVLPMCMDYCPEQVRALNLQSCAFVADGGYLQVKLGTYRQPIHPDFITGDQTHQVKDVTESAHRLLLWMFLGPPPNPADVVMHMCGNPRCLNVAHLCYGSQSDNKANITEGCLVGRRAFINGQFESKYRTKPQRLTAAIHEFRYQNDP